MRVSLGDRESEDRSADPTKTLPDDKVTVIDLQASPPNVVATSQVGSGPSGVSINRTGTLALVADRNEGAVSIFAINRKTLTPAGRLQLSDAKSGPSDVTFTPDGRMALVTRDGDHKISILAIDGEGIAMVPDGRFVALTVTNYSDKAVSFPFFSPHGFLKINKLNGTQLDPVAQIEDGHWCQGASWRRDSREILVQHIVEREIQVFDFDGHHIKVDGGARRRWHGRALMDGWTFSRRRRMQWHD
jgi:hypothetical protein